MDNPVSVVVPAYGNQHILEDCLASIDAAKNDYFFRLIVIDDSSPTPLSLGKFERNRNFSIVRNKKNLGFSGTANAGFRVTGSDDVVLVNSDVIVFDHWLDRLVGVNVPHHEIASVTAMTNEGTIASYPRWMGNQKAFTLNHARSVNASLVGGIPLELVEVPTAVGHLVYFPRHAINLVGGFDARAFSRGYGEENDWSQRAIQAGLRNFINPNVFVHHLDGASFGDEREKLKQRAMVVLRSRHPRYERDVQYAISGKILSRTHRSIDDARISSLNLKNTTLIVNHSLGGGTHRYVIERFLSLRKAKRACAIMSVSPELATLSLGDHGQLSWLSSPKKLSGEIGGVVSQLNVTEVELHSFSGFGSAANVVRFLRALCRLGVETKFFAHDFGLICPQNHLVDHTGYFCGLPSVSGCNRCLAKKQSPLQTTNIETYRENMRAALAHVGTAVVPSQQIAEIVRLVNPSIRVEIRQPWAVETLPTSEMLSDLGHLRH